MLDGEPRPRAVPTRSSLWKTVWGLQGVLAEKKNQKKAQTLMHLLSRAVELARVHAQHLAHEMVIQGAMSGSQHNHRHLTKCSQHLS